MTAPVHAATSNELKKGQNFQFKNIWFAEAVYSHLPRLLPADSHASSPQGKGMLQQLRWVPGQSQGSRRGRAPQPWAPRPPASELDALCYLKTHPKML